MTYAYGPVPLHLLTAKHCIIQIIGGESTGTNRILSSFYGLSVMPTEFQKGMDMLLAKFRDVFVFIDNILIVTKGTKSEHLDKAGKCRIAVNEIEWLGLPNDKQRNIASKHKSARNYGKTASLAFDGIEFTSGSGKSI